MNYFWINILLILEALWNPVEKKKRKRAISLTLNIMFHVWGRFLEGRQGRGLSDTEPWGSVKLLLRSKVTAP